MKLLASGHLEAKPLAGREHERSAEISSLLWVLITLRLFRPLMRQVYLNIVQKKNLVPILRKRTGSLNRTKLGSFFF